MIHLCVFFIFTVVPLLLKECLWPDVNLHHGALLSLANVLHALFLIEAAKTPSDNNLLVITIFSCFLLLC
jgi:hypothetical protein